MLQSLILPLFRWKKVTARSTFNVVAFQTKICEFKLASLIAEMKQSRHLDINITCRTMFNRALNCQSYEWTE